MVKIRRLCSSESWEFKMGRDGGMGEMTTPKLLLGLAS